MIGKEQEDIDSIHEHGTLGKMKNILNEKIQTFFPINIQQRTERCGRFRVLRASKNRQMIFIYTTELLRTV